VDVLRLHLATVQVIEEPWPVHGFVVLHELLGAVLVDSGCGGPDSLLREFRVVNERIADALAVHGLSPADVRVVVNTHLHFDHCGQNAVFEHARLCVQRDELARVRLEEPDVYEWLGGAGARFELFDGDVDLAEGLRVVRTPGHTVGHQSVLALSGSGTEVFVGDAAYRRSVWDDPATGPSYPGQADDVSAWRRSLEGLRALRPARVHFCHDTA
jgi:N-acyl homoserine lactone hydrolase